MYYVVRTGVPSIDELLHQRGRGPLTAADGSLAEGAADGEAWQAGVRLPNRNTTTSFCIVGPDGAGKSVLAMHIASRYYGDCVEAVAAPADRPHVFYVSSDLTYGIAEAMWTNFGLHVPNDRRIPFRHPQFMRELVPSWLREGEPAQTYAPGLTVRLAECPADNPQSLAARLGRRTAADEVAFVDLASRTAGDDWAFVHRLVASLPFPAQSAPRHVLIVDAIEGMETLGGDIDAFGQRTSRRARIAKLMRLAAGKCHVVLVIEEPAEGSRLPEQFVADVVIRMRSVDAHGYIRRTIEIEKARGQPIVRGRHPYLIRSGLGSTTSTQPNWDDPRVHRGADDDSRTQSYIEALPSIHHVSRSIMEDRGDGRQEPSRLRAGFGIHYLDQILARSEDTTQSAEHGLGDPHGLPCSAVTALIGDAGSQKSGLGIAFLAQAFGEFVNFIAKVVNAERRADEPPLDPSRLVATAEKFTGVAVLLTTRDESHTLVIDYFLQHLKRDRRIKRLLDGATFADLIKDVIARRTIIRRLEIHDSPPAVLFNTIRRTVEAAQQICRTNSKPDPFAADSLFETIEGRYRTSWRIRLVIDDFSTIMDTYVQVKADPLFLPFLLFYLRREGVTSVIEDTRSGGPYTPMDGFHTDLCALSDHRIYTWHVDFFGDHRIAIAPIPPVAQQRGVVVRELRRQEPEMGSHAKANLVVEPRFELYAGLEENTPRPVPLKVRLYAETEACRNYAAYLNTVLHEVFTPSMDSTANHNGSIVVTEDPSYDRLRDFSFLQGDNRLDHTLLFQVDEFWTSKATFRREHDYLCGAPHARGTNASSAERDAEDPYKTYRQLHLATAKGDRRADYFDVPGFQFDDVDVDRIPLARDFGFLMCRAQAWTDAVERLQKDTATASDGARLSAIWTRMQTGEAVSWRECLEAARHVAKIESGRRSESIRAFDLSMLAPESFSCLVLEVWASEIYRSLEKHDPTRIDAFLARLSERPPTRGPKNRSACPAGLLEWLSPQVEPIFPLLKDAGHRGGWRWGGFSLELYKTWLLLIEALDLESLQNDPRKFVFKAGRSAQGLAVAARHWYKTATVPPADDCPDPGPLTFCRLPGHFTVRGDWFLAVATGSRSDRLANRAIDLLCSPRANARRMRWGIGLPARRLCKSSADLENLYTELRRYPRGKGESLSLKAALGLGPSEGERAFSWLWRSALANYNRQNAIWQGWLYKMVRISQQLRESETNWVSGFELYDEIDQLQDERDPVRIRDHRVTGLASFRNFPNRVAELMAEFDQVSAPLPARESTIEA